MKNILLTTKVTEVDSVATRILSALNESDWSADTYLVQFINELQAATNALTIAINQSRVESQLETKDHSRDLSIQALRYLVRGYTYHPDQSIATAADVVNQIVSSYLPDITRENYSSKTGLIESLLQDFVGEAIEKNIAALSGVGEIIAKLKTVELDFTTARVQFLKSKAEADLKTSATEIKKEVVDIVNNRLSVYLDAQNLINATVYGEITRTISNIIDDNNSNVRRRNKKDVIGEVDFIDEKSPILPNDKE